METQCSIIDIISALGSIILAILAIWGRSIKTLFYKPKLSFSINTTNDSCVECVEAQSNDSNVEKELQVRLKLINKGNETAMDTISVVEEVYKQGGDGKFFRYKEYMPYSLVFHQSRKSKQHIIPKLSYYIEIAKVKCWQSNTMLREPGTNKSNHKLYLKIDEERISLVELGSGTFIVPIKTYYRCAKSPIITYVWLFWDGDNSTVELKSKFTAQLKTSKEFRSLIK